MNKRVQWRAVMLVTMATIAFGLSVRSYAATTPAATAGPTIERYNPYIDGDRLVFTQVTRQPDDSTTAAIWTRDLVTGRESLVADVQTGEPYPVASAAWTVWSEVGSGQVGASSVVRARSTRPGAKVIDVFSTEYNGPVNVDSALTLLPVALDGDRLVTTNGLHTPAEGKQLARFTLPDTRPSYVDVTTTGFDLSGAFGGLPSVAQGGRNSVYTGVPTTLFSVVDHRGVVVAAPAWTQVVIDPSEPGASCVSATGPRVHPAMDGDRIAVPAICFDPTRGFANAIATCVFPCTEIRSVPLPDEVNFFDNVPTIALDGDKAYLASNTARGFPTRSATIWSIDLATGGPARLLRRSSGAIGPRVSASGRRLVWDESVARDGVLTSDIYLMDTVTGTVTVVRPGGRDVVLPPAGPVRLRPDTSNGVLVYNELAVDDSSAGIWQRRLSGGVAQLVSSVATESSSPSIGNGWIGWNTRDPDNLFERVVATKGPGQPLVDVYNTDLSSLNPFDPSTRPVQVDVAGGRISLNGYAAGSFFGTPVLTNAVWSGRLPDGPLDRLTTSEANTVIQGQVRTNGRFTSAVLTTTTSRVHLFDEAGAETVVSNPVDGFGVECTAFGSDLTAATLVTFGTCQFQDSFVASCALPCADGFTSVRMLDGSRELSPFSVTAMATDGTRAVFARAMSAFTGRYGTRFVAGSEIVLVALSGAAPVRSLATEPGVVAVVRMDRDTIVWGSDSYDGARRGVVTVVDLRRGVTTRL